MIAAELDGLRSNGRRFSTPEVDNDAWFDGNCAVLESSGWWFGQCSASHVNTVTNAIWQQLGQEGVWNVKTARMLVRLN